MRGIEGEAWKVTSIELESSREKISTFLLMFHSPPLEVWEV